jgi:perosamine synthetase
MVPLTKPSVTDREVAYVSQAIAHGNIGRGSFVGRFESTWAHANDRAFGISTSSGSAALYIALRALGVGPGDEVIVPDFTSIACGAAVRMCAAEPMFVDCDATLNMDPELVQGAITAKTKVIMAVAIYGRRIHDRLYEIAAAANLPVLEDFAEAHGLQPHGAITCYSFYGNKILTTGEGGMCLTSDGNLAAEMRSCANFYFDRDRTNTHAKLGWNFRMTNLQAAVGLAQVERAKELIEARAKVMQLYTDRLPRAFVGAPHDVGWLFDIVVPDVGVYKRKLDAAGIESRYFFKPLRNQAAFPNALFSTRGMADEVAERGLLLPLFAGMTEQQVNEVCAALVA